MGMNRQSRQIDFLERMQQCIDRYQPLLEREFGVELGDVTAQPLRVREWVDDVLDRATLAFHEESLRKHKRPPKRTARLLFGLERRLVRLPAAAFVWFRFWYPQLAMQWRDESRAILVSFLGWSTDDYCENAARIDQYVVHELAHGIWDRLAGDAEHDRGRVWRQWNEGFAHYLADVHLRGHYPAEAVVNEDWPAFRREGKRRVGEVVDQQGTHILRRVPVDWLKLKFEATDRPPPR
jgi:hypothetical protein